MQRLMLLSDAESEDGSLHRPAASRGSRIIALVLALVLLSIAVATIVYQAPPQATPIAQVQGK